MEDTHTARVQTAQQQTTWTTTNGDVVGTCGDYRIEIWREGGAACWALERDGAMLDSGIEDTYRDARREAIGALAERI